MKCNCNESCIISKENLLNHIQKLYEPCDKCIKSTLKKSIPLKKQIKLINISKEYGKCPKCNKRHIDNIMMHILKYMIENEDLSDTASLRHVGTPLITPAILQQEPPYLSENSLVLITDNISQKTANLIQLNVPEIKGIIKGDTKKVVGQLTSEIKPISYQLLTGCDIRCDIQNTPEGTICIYKPQSKIHIEYPRMNSPKIMKLDHFLKNYSNPKIIDATCGPGTLGIYALMKNAKKVLFNDIYKTAIDTTKLNLIINEIFEDKYELYNENITNLSFIIKEKYDIGIIDAFPGIKTDLFVKSLETICDEIIII